MESATHFPLLHTPDYGYRFTKVSALRKSIKLVQRIGPVWVFKTLNGTKD